MPITAADMSEVHVAVAVIRRGNTVLIARRPDDAHQGGLLEFPGGKVEPGETVQAALVREILEETGLSLGADDLEPVIRIRHDYGDKRVLLDVWGAGNVTGEPIGLEGQEIGWKPVGGLRDEDFPAANRPIIRALKLPGVYAITGPHSSPLHGLQQLKRQLLQHRPELVLLRAPWLTTEAYAGFAEAASELCAQHGCKLMLHGRADLAVRCPGAGLHLPWSQAQVLSARPVPANQLLAVSCHNAAEVAHAIAIGADFVTLSPVQPTATHPGAEALGWQAFRDITEHSPIPVYALGGLGEGDLGHARQQGAQGLAGIRFWWDPAI